MWTERVIFSVRECAEGGAVVQGRRGCEGSQNVDGAGDIQRKGVC